MKVVICYDMIRSDALQMASHVTPAAGKIISLEQKLAQIQRKMMRGPTQRTQILLRRRCGKTYCHDKKTKRESPKMGNGKSKSMVLLATYSLIQAVSIQ